MALSAPLPPAEADVILAIGTRLQDFTTGSWTAFSAQAQFISINAAHFDASKHRALSVVGDARECLAELDAALGDWHAKPGVLSRAQTLFAQWNALLDEHQQPGSETVPSYAQVVGVVNRVAGENDTLITAAGGLPGELVKGWRVKTPNTFDCEFGFSTMGYEISAGWGTAMAKQETGGTPIVMIGDGTYLMMNSDIYSAVLSGHKMVIVVCDNGGFAVINRLQQAKGIPGFNNLLTDCRIQNPANPPRVDFVKHAEAMGANAHLAHNLDELDTLVRQALTYNGVSVIVIVSDAWKWVPGDADWDVGVPEISFQL